MSKENNTQEQQEEIYQSILGDEIPLEEETEEAPAEESSEKPKSSKKILAITGISVASVVLVGCLAVVGIGVFNKNKSNPEAPAVTSPNYTLDTKMAACYFHDMVNLYKESYSAEDLMNYYQLDLSKSLKEQNSPYEEGVTWFDTMIE
ncbi:MAG: hypothetical protein II341_04460, partial [Oscillospiraceae bacterium]|nr:hypothetical protein [Oscillospiraceae bacterium]